MTGAMCRSHAVGPTTHGLGSCWATCLLQHPLTRLEEEISRVAQLLVTAHAGSRVCYENPFVAASCLDGPQT